ncbi:MAG TPA: response regulator, partial [Polyangiaceae bacterium]|nr:response regulator [Polyangiaceae bacterium]
MPEHRRSAASRPARILICDDEARLARLTAQLLESHGFDTFAATDLTAARRHLADAPVGVIVLDVNLSGESSHELLDYLEETGL